MWSSLVSGWGCQKKILGVKIEILRTFVWRICKIINTGHWCKSFSLFAGTFPVGLWKRSLRVYKNTMVKLFFFEKSCKFSQCGHWCTFLKLLTEILRRGCKNCLRRFQTLKIVFLKTKICLPIIFGNWAKTFQPLNQLPAFWQKNFDKVVRMDFYVCRSIFGMKRCFFSKKNIQLSFIIWGQRKK